MSTGNSQTNAAVDPAIIAAVTATVAAAAATAAAPATTTAPATTAPDTAATKTVQTAAATGERSRISAILSHAEASGRDQLARHLAFETDMDVEAAVKLLTASARATAAPTNPLAAAMAREPNPNLGPDGKGDTNDAKAVAKQIAAFANGK